MLNYSYMKKELKSTTKVPSAKSLKLDEEIKRLLFLNPLMDFKIIKRTIDSLPSLMIKEKEQWIKVLKNRRNEFVIETADTSNTATRDSVIEHISRTTGILQETVAVLLHPPDEEELQPQHAQA